MESTTEDEVELTGIHLDNEPIPFEEGGLPSFLEWERWLRAQRRRRSLKLRIDMIAQIPVKQIMVTFTRDGVQG